MCDDRSFGENSIRSETRSIAERIAELFLSGEILALLSGNSELHCFVRRLRKSVARDEDRFAGPARETTPFHSGSERRSIRH